MSASEVSGLVEAMLLMATEPMSASSLAEIADVDVAQVTQALVELARFYDETERGFELREVGGGWRYFTRPKYASTIASWLVEGQHGRLSQAALETLSVIAYLQPISRSRVAAVRGVSVDGVIRTLAVRDLIREAGTDPASGATLFATTTLFLEKLGLRSVDELPELAPHLPEATALEEELAALALEQQQAQIAAEAKLPMAPAAMKEDS